MRFPFSLLLLLFNQYSILCVKILFCCSLRKCVFLLLLVGVWNSSAIRRSSNDVIEQNETMIVARNIDIGYVFLSLFLSLVPISLCLFSLSPAEDLLLC